MTADRKSSVRCWSAVSLTALTAVLAQPAIAQTEATVPEEQEAGAAIDSEEIDSEEIVVTAQRREQNILDVPMSITAISGEELEDRGIKNVQDLSFAVPSLAVQENAPGNQFISVRGVGSERGNTPLTGLYLDEVPLSGLQFGFNGTAYPDLRTLDLARVEVLKGPQGTLFGEGAAGGVVRFITNNPDLTNFGGRINGTLYNSADGGWSQEGIAIVNMPIVADEFAIRIAATYENKAGWIDRVASFAGPVIENDINDSEVVHARLKALWRPTSEFSLLATAAVHKSNNGATNIVNVDPRSASNFLVLYDPTLPLDYIDEYQIYNLTATYDFGFAELLSSSSYYEAKSTIGLFQRRPITSGGFQEIFDRNFTTRPEAFTQEARLTSQGQGPLKWTVGGIFKTNDYRASARQTDFRRPGVALTFNQLPTTQKSDAWAVFGNLSYDLTERLELGGGLRYYKDKRESFDPTNKAPTFLAGTFDSTTWRLYGSYELTDDIRTYASVGTGFRSGGFNSAGAVAQGGPAEIEPETVISYELGTKMDLANGLIRVEVAGFFSKYRNLQGNSSAPIGPGGSPVGFIGNTGEAEIKGVEWAFRVRPTGQLSFAFNGDVIDTKITKIDTSIPAGTRPKAVGDHIDFIPKYSLSISAEYEFDLTSDVPGQIQVHYGQKGKSFYTARNIDSPLQVDTTPVLRFLDASIGAQRGDGWGVTVFGRNLLDEAGKLRAGSGLFPQARPRTLGVQVEKSF